MTLPRRSEDLISIDTEHDGRTILLTENIRLALNPEAAARLCDHLMNAMTVTLTLSSDGWRGTATAGRRAVKTTVAEETS